MMTYSYLVHTPDGKIGVSDNLDFENKVQEIRNGVEYLQNAHDDEIIRLYKVIGDLQAEIKQLLEGKY